MDPIIGKLFPIQAYKNKKVFITGHTGFKGTWLSMVLKSFGAEVIGYSLKAEGKDHIFNKLEMQNSIKHIEGDVRDFDYLSESIRKFQPDFVFHLAAQALVSRSYFDPRNTFETNIIGTVNILDIVKDVSSVKSLVIITSDKCYENNEWIWGYRENDRLGGKDPYSASKASAEIVFSAYLRSFFLNKINIGIATARAGNVIGGGDISQNRIIPDCIKALIKSEPITLRSPKATRPWQHVLEPLSGYLLLALKLSESPKEYSGSWNFGPNNEDCKTVYEVAQNIISIFERGTIKIKESNSIEEAKLLKLNCDKANQVLGWHPRLDMDRSIFMTANWYKQVLNGKSPLLQTKEDLQEYFIELK